MQAKNGFARRSTTQELTEEGWTVLRENGPDFSIYATRQVGEDQFDHHETGTAIGILPAYRDDHGILHLFLIKEYKEILGKERLFIASDYVCGRPINHGTAAIILLDKTGLRTMAFSTLLKRVYGYEPSEQPNMTVLITTKWDKVITGSAKIVDLTIWEAEQMISNEEINCGPTLQAIQRLSIIERSKKMTI